VLRLADEQQDGGADRETTVFVSYSRADKEQALPIIRLLEQAGFAVWWDGTLGAGVQYVDITERALEGARAVVVLWSAQSTGSHWVRDEAMVGREHQCLIPISLDGSLPPLGFRQFQVLDFAGWDGTASAPVVQELLRATAALHDGTPVPQTAPTPMPVLPAVKTSRRGLLYLGIGGGLAVVGGLAAWRLLGDGSAPAEASSIVVLPFLNDSQDAEQDFLVVGIASELRAALARNPALRVVARSTSETLVERGEDALAIARQLGVDYVVEGSVRIAGETVRITADLIEGASGIGKWSETYSQPLAQIIELQDTLVDALSAQLSLEVTDAQGLLQLGAATVPAAFEEYLRGWDLYARAGDHGSYRAVQDHFENAIRLDPPFAGAWAGKAAALTGLGNTAFSAAEARGFYAEAEAAARRAVELGPDLGEAHSWLATIMFQAEFKTREALQPFERSVQLGAGVATIQGRYAEYAALTGDDEAAQRAAQVAVDLDPLNPTILKVAGLVHYAAGRFDEAIATQQQALAINAGISGSHSWIGSAHYQLQDYPAALTACEAEPSALLRDPCLAIIHRRMGDEAAARAAMQRLVDTYGDAGLYQQAQVLAQWGQLDAAMAVLLQARAMGDAGLNYLRMDPMLDPLREREDFRGLRTALGFT
jgi:TolB-like protein/Tfp pilus assembly protein PilF